MARVACLMMQRNEGRVLHAWLAHHAFLFGVENLFVWDNGSTDRETLSILAECAHRGVHVDSTKTTAEMFRRKGEIIGARIKELDSEGNFDFLIPLDCDEFFVLQHSKEKVDFQREAILAELETFSGDSRVLSVESAYYNVLNQRDRFWCWDHKKTFFAKRTFAKMDHGFHIGETVAGGLRKTPFSHIHFHHKPYAWMVEHSKNKLRPFMNVDDEAELKKVYSTNRLAKFILDPEEEYQKKFDTNRTILIEGFARHLQILGSESPY